MMEGLQPELPEPQGLVDPIAELGAMVSGALEQSITPAEFPMYRPRRSGLPSEEFVAVMSSDHGFVVEEGQVFRDTSPRTK